MTPSLTQGDPTTFLEEQYARAVDCNHVDRAIRVTPTLAITLTLTLTLTLPLTLALTLTLTLSESSH